VKRAYLDHNATTPVRPEVLEAALPYLRGRFGNASSAHAEGAAAREAVEVAREQVAALIGARPEEIIFTGGGTESDNLALKGVLGAEAARGRHLVITAVEHPAVIETATRLSRDGARVTVLPVDAQGMVDPEGVAAVIRPDTALVSVMTANNETGTILPVTRVGEICRSRGVLFHSDAVQAAGKLPIDVGSLPVDLLSLSAHKLNALKGVGALYVRRGTPLVAQTHGGPQERRRRAGTENVAGIVALGMAARLASEELFPRMEVTQKLRDLLWKGITKEIPDARMNGHPEHRLPNTLNACFPGADGESILMALDLEGIAVSSGSACSSGSIEPSHVLQAMGLDAHAARASIRFSLGWGNTRVEVERVLAVLPGIVRRSRENVRGPFPREERHGR
jgi:cysteine desulfurase